MAKFADLTIDINAKLCVDRNTADLCLQMVEIYCNANNMTVIVDKDPYQTGGDVHLHFQREEYK
jgi:hypothetical protein